jgi:GT2 family glycosyltransferase/glycosyltransferase involved in cell wall biosynthesis
MAGLPAEIRRIDDENMIGEGKNVESLEQTIAMLLQHVTYLERNNADSAEKREKLAERLAHSHAEAVGYKYDLKIAVAQADAERAAAKQTIAALTETVRRRDELIGTLHDIYGAKLQGERVHTLKDFWRQRGARRQRMERAAEILRRSPLFDGAWYLAQNPDVRAVGADPVMHYVATGAAEGRDPGPDFCTTWYVRTYPDVLASDCSALEHFEVFGRAAGRATRAADVFTPSVTAEVAANGAIKAGHDDAGIVFITADGGVAGHRVARYEQAARALGFKSDIFSVAEADKFALLLEDAVLVVFCGVPWDAHVADIMLQLRAFGPPILFDMDELLIDPEVGDRDLAVRIQRTMNEAAFCSASSADLVDRLCRTEKPCFLLPPGFDLPHWRTARRAVRARRAGGASGDKIRIGFFPRSAAEQAAFGLVAAPIARLLAKYPQCRLVLPRGAGDFFAGEQVEWRDRVCVEDLPWELARLDVLMVPAALGEVADESRFVEAALVGVPTVASATRTMRGVIRDGVTGLLVEEEWFSGLSRLVEDAALRARIGRDAYLDVLWPYGPERREENFCLVLEQMLHRGRRAAKAFELDLRRAGRRAALPLIPESETLVAQDRQEMAEVTVVVPLHDYADTIVEALESVRAQSLNLLDLVVVDDASSDASGEVARAWMAKNAERFGRIVLLRNHRNQGLATTRNAGFAAAETPFVLPLDADNRLLPDCAEKCLDAIKRTGAAFVYPALEKFGDGNGVFSDRPYDPARFAAANYIDATALVRLAAWAAVGGYHNVRYGWEDYDFWCRFAEQGFFGTQVPEVLGMYRVHGTSMLRSVTDAHMRLLIGDMRQRHPWILRGTEM